MDNSNSFEQQFAQNLKATAQPVQYYNTNPSGNSGNSKLSLVIIISLAAITLVESIVLLITLRNYFSTVNNYFALSEEYSRGTTTTDDEENDNVDNVYIYDDNENLTAMDVTCTTADGNSYSFTNTGTYTGGGISGTYTITNDSLISLSGSSKVLYYDGSTVADGLTIYECKENNTTAINAE